MFHFQVTSDPHVFENENGKFLFLLEIYIFQFRINMQMKQSNKRLLLNKADVLRNISAEWSSIDNYLNSTQLLSTQLHFYCSHLKEINKTS